MNQIKPIEYKRAIHSMKMDDDELLELSKTQGRICGLAMSGASSPMSAKRPWEYHRMPYGNEGKRMVANRQQRHSRYG